MASSLFILPACRRSSYTGKGLASFDQSAFLYPSRSQKTGYGKTVPRRTPMTRSLRGITQSFLTATGRLLLVWALGLGLWVAPLPALAQALHISTLHAFGGPGGDGAYPQASLIQGTDGNFYGATNQGGAYNYGTVFKITPARSETVLYSFSGGSDGANPMASLTLGTDGNFYGTTFTGGASGGTYGNGTVFKITPSGSETVLYSFTGNGNGDGAAPAAGLVQGTDGNFYGTTYAGGNEAPEFYGFGTIFKITPGGSETVLYRFSFLNQSNDTNSDGAGPLAPLIQGADGNFYGTTGSAGPNNAGTVFQITPSGAFTVLNDFSDNAARAPSAGLVQGADGNFYGTAYYGGASGSGALFKITPSGSGSVLYSFTGGLDGANPQAGLIIGSDGNFYGTTSAGGANGYGTVFRTNIPFPPFDLNGDRHPDILWQNQTTGDAVYTLLNGATPLSWGKLFTGIPSGWQIVGTPDLNQDGHPDILWQNQALGQVVYTLMKGASPLKWGTLFTHISSGWQIVGTPDLNGDGFPDILWQNQTTGDVAYTLMNGTSPMQWGQLLSGIPPGWQIVGAPDINGDGHPDILWQNTTTGQLVYTAIEGVQVLSWNKLFSVPASYPVVGAADFNGDGYADFLYQDQALGTVVISTMNGPTVIGWSNLFKGMDPNWKLVAPH